MFSQTSKVENFHFFTLMFEKKAGQELKELLEVKQESLYLAVPEMFHKIPSECYIKQKIPTEKTDLGPDRVIRPSKHRSKFIAFILQQRSLNRIKLNHCLTLKSDSCFLSLH